MTDRGIGIVERAEGFIQSNARLLERRAFAMHFRDGSAQDVMAALRPYQNADGGFGNALEPDKRCSESQPLDCEVALRMMDDSQFDVAVALRMIGWLHTITRPDGGLPFSLPSVRSAPRAPWWDTDVELPSSLNPTASIAGLLLKHGVKAPWVDRAVEFCTKSIDDLGDLDPHTVICVMLFLESAPDRGWTAAAFQRIGPRLIEEKIVALDPKAEGYVHSPLAFAPTPASRCRPLFTDEVIGAHLDAVMAGQQEDGGWNIAWPACTPLCELEYRGVVTVGELQTLKAYGRL